MAKEIEKVQISLTVEPGFKDRIDKTADHLMVSTAAFIRLACNEYIDKVTETKPDDD